MILFCAHREMVRLQRPGENGTESGVECFRCQAFFPFAHAGEKKSRLAIRLQGMQTKARAARRAKAGRKIHHELMDVRTARKQFVEFQRSGTNG